MTRSIGDVELKKSGVTAEPDVHSLEVGRSVGRCRVNQSCKQDFLRDEEDRDLFSTPRLYLF